MTGEDVDPGQGLVEQGLGPARSVADLSSSDRLVVPAA